MSSTSIATNLNKAFYIKVNLFSKVALHLTITVNYFTEPIDLFFGKVLRSGIRIDTSLTQNLLAQTGANPINIL